MPLVQELLRQQGSDEGHIIVVVAQDPLRTDEALVRDYIKFRVRGIVYASVSPDEMAMPVSSPSRRMMLAK